MPPTQPSTKERHKCQEMKRFLRHLQEVSPGLDFLCNSRYLSREVYLWSQGDKSHQHNYVTRFLHFPADFTKPYKASETNIMPSKIATEDKTSMYGTDPQVLISLPVTVVLPKSVLESTEALSTGIIAVKNSGYKC